MFQVTSKVLCFHLLPCGQKVFTMSLPTPVSSVSTPAVGAIQPFQPALRRTSWCNQVTPQAVGQTVVLNGWVSVNRDLGGITFIELRDRTGLVQLVADPQKNAGVHAVLGSLRNEAVISITGVVSHRPEETINPNHPTGTVEIYPETVTVLNRSKVLPFQLDEAAQVDEAVRLKYRYLDLRRPEMYKNLQLRHKLAHAMRTYFNAEGFLEIETPILIRTTPEGARDYLVPSRVHAGSAYALPQSPQLFKQILMMSGCERYFQLARCFRDEDLRSDRQPEFTQIDVEMSFVTQDDVMNTMEGLITEMFKEADVHLQRPFRRMTWQYAMETYGSDKPDLRFGLEFVKLTEVFTESDFAVFREPAQKGIVLALKVPGAASYSRKELDDLQKDAKRFGAKGLAYILFTEDEGMKSPILKYFSDAEKQAIIDKVQPETGDAIFFMADVNFNKACDVLGRFRIQFAKKHNLISPDSHEVTWVVDFPMFEKDEATGALSPCHHPFTAPKPDHLHLLHTAPEQMLAQAYDMAYNGAEIGGGSIRVHQPELQEALLKVIGFDAAAAHDQFGFLLEALQFGAPPHGGIAFGMDRIAQMLTGSDSIREVIAFPKNNQATCLMTQAPVAPAPAQTKELHFDWVLPEEEESKA